MNEEEKKDVTGENGLDELLEQMENGAVLDAEETVDRLYDGLVHYDKSITSRLNIKVFYKDFMPYLSGKEQGPGAEQAIKAYLTFVNGTTRKLILTDDEDTELYIVPAFTNDVEIDLTNTGDVAHLGESYQATPEDYSAVRSDLASQITTNIAKNTTITDGSSDWQKVYAFVDSYFDNEDTDESQDKITDDEIKENLDEQNWF